MSTAIILLGHGSKLGSANEELNVLAEALRARLSKRIIRSAFLQFGKPLLTEEIEQCIGEGVGKIVIIPYFLCGGVHITSDIPRELEEVKEKHPQIEIIMTDYLGQSPQLIDIVTGIIQVALK